MSFQLAATLLVLSVGQIAVLSISALNECSQRGAPVRLTGSNIPASGRVEVCIEGKWRTLCTQLFSTVDATVVCRDLGYSDKGARVLYRGFQRGSSSQKIWLVDIDCSGTEESIFDCTTRPLLSQQQQYCPHTNDVGVRCEIPKYGELRILGGPNTTAGRLEVYNNGWGTVCDDYWSRKDARVACRQLGFSTEGASAVRTGFRKRLLSDSANIWLDNLVCLGNEKLLVECRHNGLGVHNCDHSEDAGIVCQKDNSVERLLQGLVIAEMEAANSTEAKDDMVQTKKNEKAFLKVVKMLLEEE